MQTDSNLMGYLHTVAPMTNVNLRVMESKTEFPRAPQKEQQLPPSPKPGQHSSLADMLDIPIRTFPLRWRASWPALHKTLLLIPRLIKYHWQGGFSTLTTHISKQCYCWSRTVIKTHYPLVAKLLLAKHMGELYLQMCPEIHIKPQTCSGKLILPQH